MQLDRVLEALDPLIPDRVRQWRHMLDLVDADTRESLEKHIRLTARRMLGEYRKLMLLSLPPQHRSRGEFRLGSVLYDRERWDFGLSRAELLQNMVILGRSGAGKTNTVFCILEQLIEKRIPFLFLDWKRTARHLLPHHRKRLHVYTPGRNLVRFPFNPFVPPPGYELGVYVNHVVDVMADAYTLGDGARSLLHKAISQCHTSGQKAPTTSAVLGALESLPAKGRVHQWRISARRALETLQASRIGLESDVSPQSLLTTLLKQNSVIELDALNQSSKKFLIPLICLWIYSLQLASSKREQLQLVIVVEEAHHVLQREARNAKESVMQMLLRQCREIGIAMIVVDQHPHLLSAAALGNAYTSICLNQKDPADINKAAALSLVDDSRKWYFSELPIGQAIVKLQDRWTKPVLIKIPPVRLRKGSVSDDVLRRLSDPLLADSGSRAPHEPLNGKFRGIQLGDVVLDDDAFALLEDVLNHPLDGVLHRYRRLGMGVSRAHRLKERLIRSGWLETEIVPHLHTRKFVLRLSHTARKYLGISTEMPWSRESIAHAYWKHYYAHLMEQQGFTVVLEAQLGRGRVDVLASRDDRRIAIEIETGKSNAVANVRDCLLAGCERVVVVATTAHAFTTLERQLARASLLIPHRVQLIQAGKPVQGL
jgi:hypothetical protein